MHFRKTFFWGASVFLLMIFCYSEALNGQTSPGNTGSTIYLFNGKNFDGWYKFLQYRGRDNDPNQVFTVKDGMLYISGSEFGCITTNEEYENYKIVIEYKYDKDNPQSPAIKEGVARDGGVLLHSIGRDGFYSGIWMSSIEVNIIEGGTGDFIVVGDGTDRFQITSRVNVKKQGNSYVFNPNGDYIATVQPGQRINWLNRDPAWQNIRGYQGKNDIENPLGEWNRLECIAYGDKITVYLNGQLVNEALNVKPSKGKIQIQSESAAMVVKKIDLIPLTSPSSADLAESNFVRLFNRIDLEGWKIYGTEKWYVENDGTMVCESGADKEYGYLATEGQYKDFDLTLEFKQESNGNSGVFFHSSIEGTKIAGWQAEVAPPGHHSGGIYESYGRGWLIQPEAPKDTALKMGDWNTLRVRVNKDTVDTWLNGTHMIHLVDKKIGAQTGRIALQIHSGGGIKVRWRNIWVREL